MNVSRLHALAIAFAVAQDDWVEVGIFLQDFIFGEIHPEFAEEFITYLQKEHACPAYTVEQLQHVLATGNLPDYSVPAIIEDSRIAMMKVVDVLRDTKNPELWDLEAPITLAIDTAEKVFLEHSTE